MTSFLYYLVDCFISGGKNMRELSFRKIFAIGVLIIFVGFSAFNSSGSTEAIEDPLQAHSFDQTSQLIWEDNFDSYPIGPLGNQGGWNSTDTFVTDEQAQSYPHSVEINNLADAVHPFMGVNSGWWTFTTWQYVPSDFEGQSYFFLMNTYEPGNISISTQLRFDSMLGVVESEYESAQFPLIFDQWIEIKIEINLVYDAQKIYYNSLLLSEKSWTNGVSGGGAINIAAVELFANGASSIYYDDFTLGGEWVPVPELEIGNITGGIGVKAEIIAKNISAESLHWSIEFDGGFILWPPFGIKEDISSCYPITVISTFVLGIGNVQIIVSAEAPSEANATKTIDGFVLGPLVIIHS